MVSRTDTLWWDGAGRGSGMARATAGRRLRARRPALRLLGAAPWRQAPLLLRGHPAALAAVLFAGLVLGAATAATPLFLSSVANAALARQAQERCQSDYGYTVSTAGPLADPVSDLEAQAARLGGARTWPAGQRLLDRRDAA